MPEASPQKSSAEHYSAVSESFTLQPYGKCDAWRFKAGRNNFFRLPIVNRRYSRVKLCATFAMALCVTWIFSAGSSFANPNVQIHFLRTPGEGLQPQTIVDSAGSVHLVYLKGDPKPAM